MNGADCWRLKSPLPDFFGHLWPPLCLTQHRVLGRTRRCRVGPLGRERPWPASRSSLGTLSLLSLRKLICPRLRVFSQLGLGYAPRGNLAQGFCSISHTSGRKSCESNNDVWGRLERVAPVISKVESAFDPSARTDVPLTVVWAQRVFGVATGKVWNGLQGLCEKKQIKIFFCHYSLMAS